MKRDEIRELFPDASDEAVDAILDKAGGELNAVKRDLKSAQDERDAASGELAELRESVAAMRAELEEARSKLDEGLTAEEALAKREQAAAKREREFTMKANALDAKAVFVEAGCFDAEQIEALVADVTGEDAKETLARATRIAELVASQRKSAEEAVRSELMQQNPKPSGGQGGAVSTWEDFAKLPVNEQLALKQANPNIVSELLNK